MSGENLPQDGAVKKLRAVAQTIHEGRIGYLKAPEILEEAADVLHRAESDRDDYRQNLIAIDRKVRFIEGVEGFSDNSNEFKNGALWAAKEIRRGLARFAEND